jgi:type IV pilus assembly protein PilY1
MSIRFSFAASRFLPALCALLAAFGIPQALAAPLALQDVPVFLNAQNAEPLVMIAMSNDEQLYHKAYTDFDDIDGDGQIDPTYKDTINYYGYFDPQKCYSYSDPNFVPVGLASGTNSHSCSSSTTGRWSGNFLNWATMTRMDALRKVLYGGYRSTDTSSQTILERVFIPSDNHAWTKFYSASDLNQYTPYDIGTYPNGITMCNITPPDPNNNLSQNNTVTPHLRVASGQWTEWAAQESKQCLWPSEFTPNSANPNASPPDSGTGSAKIAELTVRVQVCVSGLIGTEKCKTYGTSSKPVGLLQDYADADQLKIRFGLFTGTYGKRKSGGELRKNIARFTDEVNSADGTFTSTTGIVKSINLMRITRYSYSQPGYFGNSPDNCPSGENSWSNGSCVNWGNPMGEMFLEVLRYFVGGKSPNFSSDDTGYISGLTTPSWVNPYGTASTSPVGGGAAVCAKPNILPISTGVVSFDNDEYGGASDISGLNVNTQTDSVGSNEGINGQKWYVGSITGGSASDVCTSQTISNLSAVTGICPEAAGLQGSFKIAGLAYFAHQKGSSLQTVSGKKISPVDTYAVSLAPPTPTLKIPVGNSTVKLIPVGYNLRDNNAMQLINFRVISQAADASSGTFFMNFENAPAGSDYDNDMKGYLAYSVSGSNIQIIMWQTGSSAGATQKMGYIIDGVSDAGTYYLLSNSNSFTTQISGSKFFSATVSSINTACQGAGYAADPTTITSTEECHYNVADTGGTVDSRYMRGVRNHTAGTATTNLLKQPLWYAAKYGGYKDIDGDGKPSTTAEWDTNGDGVPDNYFFVTNAGQLETQLSNAFNAILTHSGSASAASVNSGTISSSTRIYQATFDTAAWGGALLSYKIAADGTIASVADWDAGQLLPAPASRNILTTDSTGKGIPFEWANLSAAQKALLQPSDTLGSSRVAFLRGDRTTELSHSGGVFRNRESALGDIIDSSPVYMGTPPFRYSDTLESAPYSTFQTNEASRPAMIYVGANDGMMHGFDATTGVEKFAFVPTAVVPNLYQLTNPSYSHLYYVDGTPSVIDAFFGSAWHTVLAAGLNKGGREVYALDVTDPVNFTEANAATGKVLWEFTSTQDADLGYTYSRPAIVRMHNGKWAAVFGNGYNGTGTGHAVLYVLDIQTGTVIAKLDTGVGSATTPNGLATPAVIDTDGDGVVDYAYAGDLQGNLWKFNLKDSSPANWAVAYKSGTTPVPLFTAIDSSGNAQPITERPQVGYGPGGQGLVVLFGTGKFLEAADRTVDTTNPRPQSFYGIFDANTGAATDVVSMTSTNRSTVLQQQTITFEGAVSVATGTDSSGNTVNTSYNVRVSSSNPVPASKHGWYIDLVSPVNGYEAEKQVTDPVLRNGRVIFTTTIPDSDVCAYGGRSWIMELNSLTGAQLSYSPFDLNGDKKFNDKDLVSVTINGTVQQVSVTGLGSTDGLLTKPGIISGGNVEYAVSSGTGGNSNTNGDHLDEYTQNPGPGALGRQSWRQLR